MNLIKNNQQSIKIIDRIFIWTTKFQIKHYILKIRCLMLLKSYWLFILFCIATEIAGQWLVGLKNHKMHLPKLIICFMCRYFLFLTNVSWIFLDFYILISLLLIQNDKVVSFLKFFIFWHWHYFPLLKFKYIV